MRFFELDSSCEYFYQFTVLTKPLPYYEFMPFDYVERNMIKTELFNRITVIKTVTIRFKRRWLSLNH